jgi:selenobiotic family peptide radical SAM maturase
MNSTLVRWPRIKERLGDDAGALLLSLNAPPGDWPVHLESICERFDLPPFLPDLMRLELAFEDARGDQPPRSQALGIEINPSLRLLSLGWRNLCSIIDSDDAPPPEAGPAIVIVWKEPGQGELRCREARDNDLLALKVTAEGLDPTTVARIHGRNVGIIDAAVDEAVRCGLLLRPPSTLTMHADRAAALQGPPPTASGFALQWHITQACDLRCRHCYDRSDRLPLSLENGLRVIRQLRSFCQERFVSGHVSFTGGNPFLHPQFFDLYRAASEHNLQVAVLGNPVGRAALDRLLSIARPAFFQVSLEGLADHNDSIRGPGHFARTIDFLALLRERGVPSQVMLTLTKANVDQVVPLGELLRDRADALTFNRLAPFGQGASLEQVDFDRYALFCREYIGAARSNPVLGLKDSLLSLALMEHGQPTFGGCTGYGCGAAFTFLALLSDGEIHACRKFPSPIGNIFEHGLAAVYDSPLAERYRRGSSACAGCKLLAACSGCPAVTAGNGLDPFEDRDPYCWIRDGKKT